MERLTKRVDGIAVLESWAIDKDPVSIIQRLCNHLAAYEDLMERWKLRSIEEADRIFQRVNALGGTDLMAQYRAIGSIDHLRDLLQAENEGRLVVLPCKVGEYWRDWEGERVRIESVSFSFTRGHLCNTDMVTYRYDDEEDDFAVNWIYFKSHFTREEAEAALKGGEC